MNEHSWFKLGDHPIGALHRPVVIAEMSGNHRGDLARALRIVDSAAEAGAHALKIQTYTPDTITLDVDSPAFRLSDTHGLWGGRKLYELYSHAHTPWEWHAEIFERARHKGIVPFSSPFDVTAVEFLETLGAAAYKIASAEIVDLPLIREAARTGNPMIISTGMATMGEIDRAVNAAVTAGSGQVVLLACTAAYPAAAEEARLANIAVLEQAFGFPVGLSDHTVGVAVSIAAVAAGAVCIEKHVTLEDRGTGADEAFSLNPAELKMLVEGTEQAWLASRPPARFGPTVGERDVLALRRSLYVVEDVRAGEEVTKENVRSIRPAGGLATDCFAQVQGRSFTKDVPRGTPLTWDLV